MIDGRASTTERFCQGYYFFLKQYLIISRSQVDIQLAVVAENDLEFLILLILSARIIVISVKYHIPSFCQCFGLSPQLCACKASTPFELYLGPSLYILKEVYRPKMLKSTR